MADLDHLQFFSRTPPLPPANAGISFHLGGAGASAPLELQQQRGRAPLMHLPLGVRRSQNSTGLGAQQWLLVCRLASPASGPEHFAGAWFLHLLQHNLACNLHGNPPLCLLCNRHPCLPQSLGSSPTHTLLCAHHPESPPPLQPLGSK